MPTPGELKNIVDNLKDRGQHFDLQANEITREEIAKLQTGRTEALKQVYQALLEMDNPEPAPSLDSKRHEYNRIVQLKGAFKDLIQADTNLNKEMAGLGIQEAEWANPQKLIAILNTKKQAVENQHKVDEILENINKKYLAFLNNTVRVANNIDKLTEHFQAVEEFDKKILELSKWGNMQDADLVSVRNFSEKIKSNKLEPNFDININDMKTYLNEVNDNIEKYKNELNKSSNTPRDKFILNKKISIQYKQLSFLLNTILKNEDRKFLLAKNKPYKIENFNEIIDKIDKNYKNMDKNLMTKDELHREEFKQEKSDLQELSEELKELDKHLIELLQRTKKHEKDVKFTQKKPKNVVGQKLGADLLEPLSHAIKVSFEKLEKIDFKGKQLSQAEILQAQNEIGGLLSNIQNLTDVINDVEKLYFHDKADIATKEHTKKELANKITSVKKLLENKSSYINHLQESINNIKETQEKFSKTAKNMRVDLKIKLSKFTNLEKPLLESLARTNSILSTIESIEEVPNADRNEFLNKQDDQINSPKDQISFQTALKGSIDSLQSALAALKKYELSPEKGVGLAHLFNTNFLDGTAQAKKEEFESLFNDLSNFRNSFYRFSQLVQMLMEDLDLAEGAKSFFDQEMIKTIYESISALDAIFEGKFTLAQDETINSYELLGEIQKKSRNMLSKALQKADEFKIEKDRRAQFIETLKKQVGDNEKIVSDALETWENTKSFIEFTLQDLAGLKGLSLSKDKNIHDENQQFYLNELKKVEGTSLDSIEKLNNLHDSLLKELNKEIQETRNILRLLGKYPSIELLPEDLNSLENNIVRLQKSSNRQYALAKLIYKDIPKKMQFFTDGLNILSEEYQSLEKVWNEMQKRDPIDLKNNLPQGLSDLQEQSKLNLELKNNKRLVGEIKGFIDYLFAFQMKIKDIKLTRMEKIEGKINTFLKYIDKPEELESAYKRDKLKRFLRRKRPEHPNRILQRRLLAMASSYVTDLWENANMTQKNVKGGSKKSSSNEEKIFSFWGHIKDRFFPDKQNNNASSPAKSTAVKVQGKMKREEKFFKSLDVLEGTIDYILFEIEQEKKRWKAPLRRFYDSEFERYLTDKKAELQKMRKELPFVRENTIGDPQKNAFVNFAQEEFGKLELVVKGSATEKSINENFGEKSAQAAKLKSLFKEKPDTDELESTRFKDMSAFRDYVGNAPRNLENKLPPIKPATQEPGSLFSRLKTRLKKKAPGGPSIANKNKKET